MIVRVHPPTEVDATVVNGRVVSFKWRAGDVTAEMVQRAVENQAAWAKEDALEVVWDRHMERLESVRDDGPEEGPEVVE